MKFNWGIGIAVFMCCFITFILSFIIRSAFLDTELYAENYYEQEINYQQTIESKSNAQPFEKSFFVKDKTDYIEIYVPSSEMQESKSAKVVFYRPNNSKLDQTFQISSGDAFPLVFDKSNFEVGEYDIKLAWKKGNEAFLIEKNITIK